MITARAIIPIYYSSVTNTSKKIAYQTQNLLENKGFIATVTNVGDIDREDFLNFDGNAVFILSTYGNGGPPPDGEEFVEWLSQL